MVVDYCIVPFQRVVAAVWLRCCHGIFGMLSCGDTATALLWAGHAGKVHQRLLSLRWCDDCILPFVFNCGKGECRICTNVDGDMERRVDRQMKRYSIVAVHAHPDDEASKGAATMAKYATEGHHTCIVTCTGGERGDILNPHFDAAAVSDGMLAVRKQEMAGSIKALGADHVWLGYVDSGLPEGDPLPPLPEGCFALQDPEDAADKLIAVLREKKADVIITYDENGGYPHPDHIMVHTITMIAWERMGDPGYKPELGEAYEPKKLYYTHGFIRQRVEKFHEEFLAQGKPSPLADYVERMRSRNFDLMRRVTTQVPCADYFENRDQALLSHATQIDPEGTFFAVPLEMQERLWPTEEFELAQTRVKTDLPEDDLLAGLS